MIQISLVILNYNSFDFVLELIGKIEKRRKNGLILNFIIVDNNSNHSGLKENLIEALGKNDIYIQNKKNVGYAKGNNIGLRKAKEIGSEYAVILNPDIAIENENIIFSLYERARSRENFFMNGPIISGVSPYISRPNWANFLFPFTYKIKNKRLFNSLKTNIIDVYRLYGCFLFISLEVFSKIGLFDEKTFLYGEEEIIAEKIFKSNYKMFICTDIIVQHRASSSVNKFFKFKKYFFMFESWLIYLQEYRQYSKPTSYIFSANMALYRFLVDRIKIILSR
ncbi:MAG: glycosyltransferase family 2 protein [Flavobacteriaceae bacterium]|nr:glycosyltransferase family 2 protein [Flavobacteriaceae bacterium]